jgi:hypothetical protein
MVYYRNKQLARALNGVESGDEISANIGGDTYHGVVTTVYDNEVLEDNTPVELELDALEEGCINIAVEYVGDGEVFGIEHSDDDYVIYAVVGDGDEQDVNAVINWEDEASAPDITITELEDDELAELQPEFEAAVSDIERGLTELQEMRKAYSGFLEGVLTMAEVEERIEELTLESGGQLVLDRGL